MVTKAKGPSKDKPEPPNPRADSSPTTEEAPGRGDQKRRGTRVPIRRHVESAQAGTRLSGLTKDVSCGGMFLATADILPIGAEVDLKLQLHGGSPPTIIRGRVVRTCATGPDRGMALAFQTQGSPIERQFIASFVRETEYQLKLDQLEAAKREFLGEVRAFQEEKIAVEIQRLATADEKLKQSREAHALSEERRQLRTEHDQGEQALEAHRRALELDAERARREVQYTKEDLRRGRLALDEDRNNLAAERERFNKEMADQQHAADEERRLHLEGMDRERKLLKHVAARKTTSQQHDFDQRAVQFEQTIATLQQLNQIMEKKCRALENQVAHVRNQCAGKVAVLESRLAEIEGDHTKALTNRQVATTHLETSLDERSHRLLAVESELAEERRKFQERTAELSRRLQEAESQVARLTTETTQVSAGGTAAASDYDALRQRCADLETRVKELQLELDETRTRLEFRNSMFEELQAQLEEEEG